MSGPSHRSVSLTPREESDGIADDSFGADDATEGSQRRVVLLEADSAPTPAPKRKILLSTPKFRAPQPPAGP
eukprot:CAMPEP_0197695002 /NCGR_PEP_ID=MMETSP1338-20131121/114615_1 /TAXON_ID=43686 ORGANISM="Pelagodinium beii, Strain RCC1491" /NCGR_SAMPLE_ID=MMETSP1338 /ASSEMBLY_ACC=CAM_ASM_000754 /LENGTH=71 /DNA_ID=CAMNT_0043277921 /DNA_START=42 /DNA_END=254 /DNA_ORIENTATION=+